MSTVSDEQTKADVAPNDSTSSPQPPTSDTPLAPASDSRRTMIFIGVAVASLVITAAVEFFSQPAEIAEYGRVGEEFYPEFTDPTVATSLVVKAINDKLEVQEFSVRKADSGRWVIPSHHDYPADAEDQLAQTAASVIGIERKAMESRWPTDHVKYGVVDPETDSVGVNEMEGLGKRLTLRGEDDTVLASFVIGNKVEDAENEYYVRHPGEDEIYIAELDIDLSTKFSDWVDTELLGIQDSDIRNLVLLDYSFEERGPAVALTQTETSTLTRETAEADWQLAELNEESKEVNSQAVSETVNTLSGLEIIGVRPKQPGLTADLQIDRSVIATQRDLDRVQADLVTRGFILQASESDPNQLRLLAREGEMAVGTEAGLTYNLHFGRAFTGTDEELETGLNSTDENDAEADNNGDSASASSAKPGRYVFIRVDVTPSLFGEKPQPVRPEMPAELTEDKASSAEEVNNETPTAEKSDVEETESAEGEEAETEEDRLARQQAEYDAAMQKFIDDQRALDEYESKLEQAEQRAEELNRRFAQWYYVIPGESYDKLTLSREDLLQDKATDAEGPAVGSEQPMPQFNIDIPTGDTPLTPPAAQTAEEPTAEEPTAEEPTAEEPAEEEPVKAEEAVEEEAVETETPDTPVVEETEVEGEADEEAEADQEAEEE